MLPISTTFIQHCVAHSKANIDFHVFADEGCRIFLGNDLVQQQGLRGAMEDKFTTSYREACVSRASMPRHDFNVLIHGATFARIWAEFQSTQHVVPPAQQHDPDITLVINLYSAGAICLQAPNFGVMLPEIASPDSVISLTSKLIVDVMGDYTECEHWNPCLVRFQDAHSNVATIVLCPLIQACHQLQVLSIQHMCASWLPIWRNSIVQSGSAASLLILDVSDQSSFTLDTALGLADLLQNNLVKLQELDISRNSICVDGFDAIAKALLLCTTLKTLRSDSQPLVEEWEWNEGHHDGTHDKEHVGKQNFANSIANHHSLQQVSLYEGMKENCCLDCLVTALVNGGIPSLICANLVRLDLREMNTHKRPSWIAVGYCAGVISSCQWLQFLGMCVSSQRDDLYRGPNHLQESPAWAILAESIAGATCLTSLNICFSDVNRGLMCLKDALGTLEHPPLKFLDCSIEITKDLHDMAEARSWYKKINALTSLQSLRFWDADESHEQCVGVEHQSASSVLALLGTGSKH